MVVVELSANSTVVFIGWLSQCFVHMACKAMEKKLESNKKELHDLVTSLEEKFGGAGTGTGGGDDSVKKGAEAQIMKKAGWHKRWEWIDA